MSLAATPAGVFARTLALGALLYPLALATHEVMHLVALQVIGGEGSLIVHAYRFSFLPVTVAGFHAQPGVPLAVWPHAFFDFAGPALAALLVGALALLVSERVVRTALLANLGILGFYAVIEPLDVLLDSAGLNLRFLLSAEFNYGVPLLVLLVASLLSARHAPG